jgi:hypothetical protein
MYGLAVNMMQLCGKSHSMTVRPTPNWVEKPDFSAYHAIKFLLTKYHISFALLL